jgi:uncharacterized protein
MPRILFWLALIFLVNWWWRKQSRASIERTQARDPRARPASAGAARTASAGVVEPMARCAQCGVHLPQSEAVAVGGRTYCSVEHARAAGEA